MNSIQHYISPLGRITLVSCGGALTGLYFDHQKYAPDLSAAPSAADPSPALSCAARWLDIYFSGKKPDFSVPLALHGTPFQRAVWQILLSIPYGETVTYGEIAAQIARQQGLPRMSAQAVGGAVGRNPVSIIVPCHRVLGSSGSLTGYAGGIDRKARLLSLEGVSLSSHPSSKGELL